MSGAQLKIELYHPKYHQAVLQYGLDIPYKTDHYFASWSNLSGIRARAIFFSMIFVLSGYSYWMTLMSIAAYEVFLKSYLYYSWAYVYAR